MEATLAGKRILWNHTTRIYDDKPTRIRASLRQKTRWAQGHWFVALRNTGKVFSALFAKRISLGEALSLLTYMYSLSTYLIALIQLVISLILMLPGFHYQAAPPTLSSLLSGLAIFAYSYFMLFYLADWMDNGIRFHLRTLPLMIWSVIVNTVIAALEPVGGPMEAPPAAALGQDRAQHPAQQRPASRSHGRGRTQSRKHLNSIVKAQGRF